MVRFVEQKAIIAPIYFAAPLNESVLAQFIDLQSGGIVGTERKQKRTGRSILLDGVGQV